MSRSSSDRIKPQASSHCPSAGSSNAPSLGSAAADDWPRTGNASTTRPSPSCASPPSASCCENYAIPHDVLGQTLMRRASVCLKELANSVGDEFNLLVGAILAARLLTADFEKEASMVDRGAISNG